MFHQGLKGPLVLYSFAMEKEGQKGLQGVNISGGSWIDLVTALRVIPRNGKAVDGYILSLVQGGHPAPGKWQW